MDIKKLRAKAKVKPFTYNHFVYYIDDFKYFCRVSKRSNKMFTFYHKGWVYVEKTIKEHVSKNPTSKEADIYTEYFIKKTKKMTVKPGVRIKPGALLNKTAKGNVEPAKALTIDDEIAELRKKIINLNNEITSHIMEDVEEMAKKEQRTKKEAEMSNQLRDLLKDLLELQRKKAGVK